VLDACQGKDLICAQHLLKFIKDEAKTKTNEDWDMGTWRSVFPISLIENEPQQQKNDYDCGMFVLMYAQDIAVESQWRFTRADMPIRREEVSNNLTYNAVGFSFRARLPGSSTGQLTHYCCL
jgi:Ulp1 family protease